MKSSFYILQILCKRDPLGLNVENQLVGLHCLILIALGAVSYQCSVDIPFDFEKFSEVKVN